LKFAGRQSKAGESILKIANRYLLICGAPKCGTTSLFRYLSDHPDICPGHRKETYFFAREFDLAKVCQVGETLEDFEAYFSHCHSGSKLRLEATPYTLYAKDAAQKISSLLQDAVVVFVLRDPIQRLISDYKFSLQRGHRSTRYGTFQSYLKWQKRMPEKLLNQIEMGCYVRFLKDFIDVFGKNRVAVIFFEDLISNRVETLRKLCGTLGIDDSFYSTYDFGIHNPSINYRSSRLNRWYIRLEPVIANIKISLINKPKLHNLFEQTIDFGKVVYRLVNSQKSNNKEGIPPEILEELAMYYRPHNELLSEELSCPLPWNTIDQLVSRSV
jgi:hypothetical protein